MKEKENTNLIGRVNRLNEAVAYLKGKRIAKTQKAIAKILEVDEANLSKALNGNEVYLTDPFLKKFANIFEFDTNWLLTGQGTMLETEMISPNYIKKIETKAIERIHDIQTVPIYDSIATLGLVEVFNGAENGNVLDYLSIPNLPKSDGAIFMTGDSMYPILKSGDIVALKIIHKSDIIYGEMHYLEYYSQYGDIEFKTIKYIKKSDLGDDYVKLVSQNQHHEPKDILLSQVGTIAIVNASVRYNRL